MQQSNSSVLHSNIRFVIEANTWIWAFCKYSTFSQKIVFEMNVLSFFVRPWNNRYPVAQFNRLYSVLTNYPWKWIFCPPQNVCPWNEHFIIGMDHLFGQHHSMNGDNVRLAIALLCTHIHCSVLFANIWHIFHCVVHFTRVSIEYVERWKFIMLLLSLAESCRYFFQGD